MDPRTRKAIVARDGAVARINKVTWRIGTASFGGALLDLGDVHMAALRRKIGVDGLVETVYGRGFRLGPAD